MNDYIKMRCEDCGAIMEVDKNKQILFCPYCGSKKLIEESDDVKKAKIESATRIHEADKETERVISTNKSQTLQSLFGLEGSNVKIALLFIFLLLLFLLCIIGGCIGNLTARY